MLSLRKILPSVATFVVSYRADAQSACLTDFKPADVASNKGAQCFAFYAGFLPDADSSQAKKCGHHKGMEFDAFPGSMFVSRGAEDDHGAKYEDDPFMSTTKGGNLVKDAGYRFQTSNRLETFQNPGYRPEGLQKGLLALRAAAVNEKRNGSLTIVGSTKPSAAGGFFTDMRDLDTKCDAAAGSSGAKELSQKLLADLVFFGFFGNNFKEWRVMPGHVGPTDSRPSLTSLLTVEEFEKTYFCAHNSAGGGASVNYLHLHATQKVDYEEFNYGPGASVPDLDKPDSWTAHNAVCVKGDVGAAISGDMQGRVTAVGQRLYELTK